MKSVAIFTHFSQSSYYRRPDKVCCHANFRTPFQLLLGGLLGQAEAGRLALRPRPTHSSPLANSLTVRMLSKMVKKPRRSLPHTFSFTPSSPHKALWSPTWLTSFFRSCKSLWRVTWTIMCLSEFHDSRQSFSISAFKLAMKAFAMRFLWSASAGLSNFAFW